MTQLPDDEFRISSVPSGLGTRVASATRGMFKRSLIFVHRWLGVALCVLFLLWFPSGIGMMYFPMPSVTQADRLQRLPALQASNVVLSPRDAAAKLGVDADDLPLELVRRAAGVPRGRRTRWRRSRPLRRHRRRARRGLERDGAAHRAAWTGQPVGSATVEEVTEVDQWTLQTRLGLISPVFKYSWPNGEQVYVSQATGDVVQYTTTASRIGAYLGPIPHWFYFTPLRKHGLQWSRVVIWSSGIGTISAILGVIIGVWMYSPSRKYRSGGAPTSIPYRGQKRWHTMLGLIFGVATVTYAFSGLLSMDPFPSFNDRVQQRRGGGEPNIFRALRGDLDPRFRCQASERGARAAGAAGERDRAHLVCGRGDLSGASCERRDPRGADARGTAGRLRSERHHSRRVGGRRRPDDHEAAESVRPVLSGSHPPPSAAGGAGRGHERPADPLLHRPQDGARRPDLRLEQLGQQVAVQRVALSELPVVINYRPLWDIVVITLMLGGTALCVTSLVLAWRVLGRKLARALNANGSREPTLSEDLA